MKKFHQTQQDTYYCPEAMSALVKTSFKVYPPFSFSFLVITTLSTSFFPVGYIRLTMYQSWGVCV